MEIRQLRYFLSAVRHGSLKEAAREHFVTQPAVSIQLRKLEEEVGEKLYSRRGRRIVPSQAGALLVQHGAEILRRIDTLKQAIGALGGLEYGVLRLGNIDAASIYVLPPVFRTFQRKYPRIDIQVTVADTDGLLTSLDTGSIELAIVTLPVSGDGLTVVPFFKESMVLVVNPSHELAGGQSGRRALAAVARSGLITYPSGSTTRRVIERVFIDNGLGFRAAMEMSSPEAIKRLTEAGLGASILPHKVVEDEVSRGTLSVIPTGRVKFFRMLGIVYKNADALSAPARVFLKMLVGRRAKQRTVE
jgi:DNA-binding transcriptional LysR family regulator